MKRMGWLGGGGVGIFGVGGGVEIFVCEGW
jgi:hypothetical protein